MKFRNKLSTNFQLYKEEVKYKELNLDIVKL